LAFAGKDAIGFTHDGIGIRLEFERVRQDDGVDGAIGNRQL
jgi:hypothetical protein